MKIKLLILLCLLLLAGCGQQETITGIGTLQLRITDQKPEMNITEAIVTVSNVQVHRGNDDLAGWETILAEQKSYDLIKLQGVNEVLGTKEIPSGLYTQIRLNVDSATAVIDGQQYTLEIPSGNVKLVNQFNVLPNEILTLTLDFDPQKSIHSAGNKYIMQPTIKVLEGDSKCFNTAGTSTEAPDHVHKWCENMDVTEEFCNDQGECHSHNIDEAANLALPAGLGPHTHMLHYVESMVTEQNYTVSSYEGTSYIYMPGGSSGGGGGGGGSTPTTLPDEDGEYPSIVIVGK